MKQERLLAAELEKTVPGMRLLWDEPMSRHTSFRIGGPARLLVLPRSAEELKSAYLAALRLEVPVLFMGNGSNLLAPDGGLDRFVIKTFDGLSKISRTGETEVTAESGVLLSKLAVFARNCGLSGLEFSYGIPGTFGGAITMNAGAYDGEIGNVVAQTEYLDPAGEVVRISGKEHDFSYRHSIFSSGERLILRGKLSLRPGNPAEIQARMDELSARRKRSQPLELPSAGSVFKRPPGNYAAALIDRCALKGRSVGGAQVSEKHAGFIVNRGGATCDDVLRLIDLVRETVSRETGVELETEIRILSDR